MKCKGYNPSADLCTRKWTQPVYDGKACGEFVDPPTPKVVKERAEEDVKVVTPAIKKRGTSHINKSRVVKGVSQKQNGNENAEEESTFVLKVPELALHGLGMFLLILLLCGVGYGTYYYISQQKAQEREDLVWKGRVELEAVKSEKTIEYLKLQKMDYADGLLTLSFLRNYHHSNPYQVFPYHH